MQAHKMNREMQCFDESVLIGCLFSYKMQNFQQFHKYISTVLKNNSVFYYFGGKQRLNWSHCNLDKFLIETFWRTDQSKMKVKVSFNYILQFQVYLYQWKINK